MHAHLDPQDGNFARLLRALPNEGAPPYGYHEFERRAAERERSARGLAGRQRLAVATVIGVTLLAVLVRLSGPAAQRPRTAGVQPVLREAPGPEDDSLPPRAGAAERWLASLPSEPAMVRVGARVDVMGLEDRIAQVDDLLSAARSARDQPGRLAALQQERARLVGTLVQVRYAQTLANGSP